MKKKIAILGATGSIGQTTLRIIKNNKKKLSVELLTTNKNYKKLITYAKDFNVKNVIIFDNTTFLKQKLLFKNKKLNLFNDLHEYKKKNKKKFDYAISAIPGISGLKPTLDLIPLTKKIAIANKESIICGWNLIKKKLNFYNTRFIPVDSEHFSIWSLIKNSKKEQISKIYLTASGGPFLNWSNKAILKVSSKIAIKHPNWSMGRKISIDSATLMNKIFEVIEAQRIFNLPKLKFDIVIHERSYVHALVEFKNGIKTILVHDTDMTIPISNSIFEDEQFKIKNSKLNFLFMNNLNFKKVDHKKFPVINLLKIIPNTISLFETVLTSANDELVDLYLKDKIDFNDIQKNLKKILKSSEFNHYRFKTPQNAQEINTLNDYVRLKTRKLCI